MMTAFLLLFALSTQTADQGWYERGIASLKANDARAAAQAFEQSAAAGVNKPLSLYNAACSYARLDERDQALDALKRLLAIAPMFALRAFQDDDLKKWRGLPAFAQLEQQAIDTISPCRNDPKSAQFNFWVGDWEVYDRVRNVRVGTSKIERSLDGCLVIENWEGRYGDTGKSLNTVNPATGGWQQYWVASNGTVTQYDGTFGDGAMRLTGVTHARNGKATNVRLTFTPQPDGSVRQHGEAQPAAGGDWTTTYDFLYRKASPQ